MIAESLKRRHSGLDDPEQPPKKILCVHNNRQNQDPGNSRIISKKRPLSDDKSETGTENIIVGDDRWIRLKRRRIKQEREADSDEDTMQIKGAAQYRQSPAKNGKSKRAKKNKGPKAPANAANAQVQGAGPAKVEDPAFNDLFFWRPVLPNIEDDLAKFFEDSMEISESSTSMTSSSEDEEESTDKFSSFNFWRVPICEVDVSAIH